MCAEHIALLTNVKWQLLGTESKGSANLSGLILTQNMLDLVRMSPLQWGKTIRAFSIPLNKVFKLSDIITSFHVLQKLQSMIIYLKLKKV